MKNESYTVFDGDFHAHIEEKYLQQQHFVCRTLENIKELDAWRQGTMSSNLRMCTDLFSNKLDTLVREHVGFAHDLWSLMNWSNPGSDLLSKIGDLHEEHRDIIDECIEELLPRLITVLSASEEQLLGPMNSSEIITEMSCLNLPISVRLGDHSFVQKSTTLKSMWIREVNNLPGFSTILCLVPKLKIFSTRSILNLIRNSVMLSMLGCATSVVRVHSLNLNCRPHAQFL